MKNGNDRRVDMLPEMPNFDEEEQVESEVVDNNSDKQLVEQPQNGQKLAFKDYKLENIEAVVDSSKSFSQQVEDFVDVNATMAAAKDEATQEILTQQKKEQLIGKASTKVKEAQRDVIKAETEIQKAERETYEGILETFGFFRHLPRWLLKAIVVALTPFYFVIGLLIGVPCGIIKILIDNIDSIICKYEKTEDKTKPRIKVVIWILLALIALGAICLTVLGCLHII